MNHNNYLDNYIWENGKNHDFIHNFLIFKSDIRVVYFPIIMIFDTIVHGNFRKCPCRRIQIKGHEPHNCVNYQCQKAQNPHAVKCLIYLSQTLVVARKQFEGCKTRADFKGQ